MITPEKLFSTILSDSKAVKDLTQNKNDWRSLHRLEPRSQDNKR